MADRPGGAAPRLYGDEKRHWRLFDTGALEAMRRETTAPRPIALPPATRNGALMTTRCRTGGNAKRRLWSDEARDSFPQAARDASGDATQRPCGDVHGGGMKCRHKPGSL